MTQIKPGKVAMNLMKKGFVEDKGGDHIYYTFIDPKNGTETSICTKISHNSKPLGDAVLSKIKSQLRFRSKKDLVDFLICKINRDEYCEMLYMQGDIKK